MVHTFGLLNRLFALDTESGSFFEIDPIVKAIIDGDDMSPFSSCEITEAQAEIDRLKADGVLFAPPNNAALPPYSPVIKAMCLNVSHNCNLACTYCFADGGTYRDERRNMSFETAKAAIDMLVDMSGKRRNLEVDFFGGEPMLNLDTVKRTVYYARSLELLDKAKRDELFYKDGANIYTKVRDSAPARFSQGAKVTDSLVADGCEIEGEVRNSILFRGVKVAAGAKVFNSIVFQGSEIGKNSLLNCVIADKRVTILEGRTLSGHETHPYFIAKSAVI